MIEDILNEKEKLLKKVVFNNLEDTEIFELFEKIVELKKGRKIEFEDLKKSQIQKDLKQILKLVIHCYKNDDFSKLKYLFDKLYKNEFEKETMTKKVEVENVEKTETKKVDSKENLKSKFSIKKKKGVK